MSISRGDKIFNVDFFNSKGEFKCLINPLKIFQYSSDQT